MIIAIIFLNILIKQLIFDIKIKIFNKKPCHKLNIKKHYKKFSYNAYKLEITITASRAIITSSFVKTMKVLTLELSFEISITGWPLSLFFS